MSKDLAIIDCHLHSGVQHVNWDWDHIRPLLLAAGITGAAPIPPVEDIYDRYNHRFTDTPAWQACRRRAHQYLLELKDPEIAIYPYFFVWNDFAYEDLGPEYVAIKWHRHPDEPVYHYDDPRCGKFLDAVRERRLPILLEESLENTLFFLDELAPDLAVIIPHLGGLNGGYVALDRAGVWRRPQVFADTAVAALPEIKDFLRRFGSERLLFGSDYPFGNPASELAKILSLDLPHDHMRAILGDNFRRLCRLD
ncbi:MAG: amidohydrolase family protein [Thermodesulfobacteriota bacterium]